MQIAAHGMFIYLNGAEHAGLAKRQCFFQNSMGSKISVADILCMIYVVSHFSLLVISCLSVEETMQFYYQV